MGKGRVRLEEALDNNECGEKEGEGRAKVSSKKSDWKV